MKKNFTSLCALCILCALCAISCSHIDEDERLIYVQPAAIGRAVLIEDFTGQRCVNCPTATQTIHELQEAYGDSNVVAVAIHSGAFAKSASGKPYPLMTETGDEYYNYWELDHQPVGIINRRSPSDYSDWGTQVYNLLKENALVKLSATVEYETSTRTLNVTIHSIAQEGAVDGKLQLWLTEDSIQAFQYMPDGTNNKEYIHNHVFRDAVNGTWGTDFHLDRGENRSESFTYTIAEEKDWKPENMHLVAFVYTSNGVEQVVARPLKGKREE